MGRIRVLAPDVVNKIAAGEVVERPASLVKELVENALDAGAKHVRVDVEDGGRRLVRVTDDGAGIAGEDLPVAFESHATSKLESADDLYRVTTLGFRGEALASIGSVAQVRLKSRKHGTEGGAEIEVDAGQRADVRPAALPEGTDIEVRNLFLNVPVRRKFLRKPRVEFEHVHEAVARFAVAHPEVRFDLAHNGIPVFNLPSASDVRERIAHFFGKDLAGALMEVRSDEPPARFRALIAPPAFSKLTLKGQYVYLNGRFIRDRIVTRAINESYREALPHGRYPVVFLFLEVEPGEVDVNVHPTKIEVRFRNVWRVHDRIVDRLSRAVLGSDAPRDARPAVAPPGPPPDVYREVVDFFSSPTREERAPAPLVTSGRRFFQINDRYIVEEADEGIRIFDQHALHERVMLDRLRRAYSSGDLPAQRLLMPAVVTLSPARIDLLEEHGEVLRSFGIEAERSGPGSVAVRAIPAALRDDDPASLAEDLVERIEEHGESERKAGHRIALLEPLIEFLACRSAIKFGNRLSPEEVAHLLEEAAALDFAGTCAHGRPTVVELKLDELEKLFERS
ncbi:MAG: DNA mismatch repair endonuclease MutL [Planctomycetota bacterium]|jgi:DNA mismatch repair protein MutL